VTQQRSLVDKLKERIAETREANLILPRHLNMLNQALDDETLDFRVPKTVTARITSRTDNEYGFDIFRCSHCGRLYSFRDAIEMRLRCQNCASRSSLSQAPIFSANFRDRPPTPIPFSEAVHKITLDWNSNYCVYTSAPMSGGRRLPNDFLKGLTEADRSRPIDSLCWTCPILSEPCQWRDEQNFCTYSRYSRENWRPDLWSTSQRIRLMASPFARRRTAFATYVDRYRPVTISEGMTKPIRVVIHNFSDESSQLLRFHEDELRGISEIRFVRQLEVFQFTIALAVGLPYVSIRNRAIRLLSDGSDENPYVLSRRLITEGIVVRLRPEVRDRILGNWTHLRPEVPERTLTATLYHTVSHAFVKPLPMIAGLDASEFNESFSPMDNEVSVYDNSPGGIGGVRTVVDEGSFLRGDYVAQLLTSLDCQLDCLWSCKACLHTGNCGWINRQLKRDMLQEIIDERLRDRYFGS
jgi:hypothetical protein